MSKLKAVKRTPAPKAEPKKAYLPARVVAKATRMLAGKGG